MHGGLAANPRRANRRRYSSNRRRYANPTFGQLATNPPYSGLFENPSGPLSAASMKSFAVASAGLAIGLAVARGTDRWIATMKPADSKSGQKANRAWFGRAAAAAINRRPTIIRLGVQAGGAVLGIAGAYALRNKGVAPWLLGGIALGFGSNLFLQFIEWWAIPWLLKTKDSSEQTLANRMYALEQLDAQDKVDGAFEDWALIPALAQNQDQNNPIISSPLSLPTSIATLGRPGARRQHAMVGAARKFIADGRVGNCDLCGGNGGHYSGCSACDTCNGGGRKCAYTVQPGVDIYAVATQSGISVNEISAMNGGGSPESFWIVGNEVVMPEAACNIVARPSGTPLVPQTSLPTGVVVNTPPVGPTSVYVGPAPTVPPPAGVVYGTPNRSEAVNYATVGGNE
jgi:hypothetical protein